MTSLRSIEIAGVHPVIPTEEQFQEALAIQYGEDLTSQELILAENQVCAHFAGLYLVEIEIDPPRKKLDWFSAITQPVPGQPHDNWQMPYDERRLDAQGNRWAFFFHFLDTARPLQTPLGDRSLPPVSPTPEHLQSIIYEVPG